MHRILELKKAGSPGLINEGLEILSSCLNVPVSPNFIQIHLPSRWIWLEKGLTMYFDCAFLPVTIFFASKKFLPWEMGRKIRVAFLSREQSITAARHKGT